MDSSRLLSGLRGVIFWTDRAAISSTSRCCRIFGWRKSFQFRYEPFNVLNRANLQLPERRFNSLEGGLITGVTDRGRRGPRVMQAALKFEF